MQLQTDEKVGRFLIPLILTKGNKITVKQLWVLSIAFELCKKYKPQFVLESLYFLYRICRE